MACSSVSSSKLAPALLSNGLTVWYPMVLLSFRFMAAVAAGFNFVLTKQRYGVAVLVLWLPISPSTAHSRCCRARRETADIASVRLACPRRRAETVWPAFGRQVVPR